MKTLRNNWSSRLQAYTSLVVTPQTFSETYHPPFVTIPSVLARFGTSGAAVLGCWQLSLNATDTTELKLKLQFTSLAEYRRPWVWFGEQLCRCTLCCNNYILLKQSVLHCQKLRKTYRKHESSPSRRKLAKIRPIVLDYGLAGLIIGQLLLEFLYLH